MRKYNYLKKDEEIVINNTKIKIEDLIYQFAPLFTNNSEMPLQCLFEAIQKDKTKLILIYRFVWKNEKHPNILINTVYTLYRYLWYGSLKDIEAIAIVIDINNNLVEKVIYEEPIIKKIIVEHQIVEVNINEKLNNAKRSTFEVISWNHLFSITKEKGIKTYKLLELNDYNFKKLRILKRSNLNIKFIK